MASTTIFRSESIDPRARLLAGATLLAGLMVLPWGWPLWSAALLAPLAIAAVRPPLNRLFTALFALSWMLLITVAVHAFSTPGHILWELPALRWTLTLEGLEKGVLFAARLAAVVLVGAAVSLSVGPLEGVRAVESLAKPLRKIGVPVASLALIFGLALRFVPTLFDEAKTLKKALTARGWTQGKGVAGRVRAWIPLFIPLLASGLRRGDDIAETLVLRGYAPGRARTSWRESRWGWRESALLALTLVPFVLLAV